MITSETTPDTSEETMENTTNHPTGKPGWKGKRGQLLQETGTALLSESGTDKEKIERFLEEEA